MIDTYLVQNPDIVDQPPIPKGTKFTPEEGLGMFFNGKRAIERMDRCLQVCQKMEDETWDNKFRTEKTKLAYGAQQYRELGYAMRGKLFFDILPHKLKEARAVGDKTKTDEIIANWKRLMKKYKVQQDLTQYGVPAAE
ncbi:MAG: hypothetical protein RI947_1031 [Candidatus Parcubacteria bacterium]